MLIVTLRRKHNWFEHKMLYYFLHFYQIYTLKCAFQSVGRFITVRLITPILFWMSLSKASTNTVHSLSDERRYFIANKIWYKPLCTGGGVTLSTYKISGAVCIVQLYILELWAHILRNTETPCSHEANLFLDGFTKFPLFDLYL